MQHENKKPRRLVLAPEMLLRGLDVLLQLADGILQRGAGIVDLIDDEDILSDEIGHLERAQVQPLRAGDFGAGDLLGVAAAEVFVQGEADGLDGDVGLAGAFEEGSGWSVPVRSRFVSESVVVGRGSETRGIPQDSRGHITAAANGYHKIRLEGVEDFVGGGLAQFVHLDRGVSCSCAVAAYATGRGSTWL